jgi:hypothetical protein
MSAASTYAATQAAAAAEQVTANNSAPAPFGNANTGLLSITTAGSLRITSATIGPGEIVLSPAQAVAAANWILANFS